MPEDEDERLLMESGGQGAPLAPGETDADAYAAGAVRGWVRSLLTHRLAGDFVLGGCATVTAVLFTNPIEVPLVMMMMMMHLHVLLKKGRMTMKLMMMVM